MVSIHNFPGVYLARGKELDTVFPLNTVIAIREPRARKESLTATGKQPFIEVDSPSDLIFLDAKDPILADISWSTGSRSASSDELSPLQWKEIGNNHFKNKEFFAAAVAYTYALRQDPSFTAVRLNRCLAHLRLSNFTASIHDANIALGTENIAKADRMKAVARAAQAEYGNENYENAIKLYQEWLELEPGVKDAINGIKSCNKRIREKGSGEYDWKQLLLDSETPCARPDVAEYIGPVKVTNMEDGVGFRATAIRDVKAGELLVSIHNARGFKLSIGQVVSKAFASTFPEEALPGRRVFTLDFLTDRGSKESQYTILQQLVTKVAGKYPRYVEALGLPAGPNFPIADSATVQGGTEDATKVGDPMYFGRDIDTARLEAITSFSSFEFPHATKIVSFASPLGQPRDNSIALHIRPSFFNHSCIPNARWMPFGHIMVIRAVHDIAEGEEITLSYCGWRIPFKDRKKPVLRYFSNCKCRLCLSDEAAGDDFHDVHRRIYEALDHGEDIPLDVIKEYVKEVDPIWPESYPGFRPLAFHVHRPMASQSEKATMMANNAISRNRMAREGIKHEIISIEALGVVVIDKGVKEPPKSEQQVKLPVSMNHIPYNSRSASLGCLMISGGFLQLGAPWRAEMWVRCALYCTFAFLWPVSYSHLN